VAAPVVTAVLAAAGASVGAAAFPLVNPVWLTLASILNEVPAGFRATSALTADQELYLRVVESLASVVNGLALTPHDPALLAEYHELVDFLRSHPDSAHLGAFVASHPSIVQMVSSAQ